MIKNFVIYYRNNLTPISCAFSRTRHSYPKSLLKDKQELATPCDQNDVEKTLKLQLEPKNKLGVASKLYLKINATQLFEKFPDIIDKNGNILANNQILLDRPENDKNELTNVPEGFIEVLGKDIKIDPLLLTLEEKDDKQSIQWWTSLKKTLIDNVDYKRTDKTNRFQSLPMLFRYGSADPSIPKSDIPCQGCGAYLHCQDEKLPGFLPSEKFKLLVQPELRLEDCQRCYLLKNYNIDLHVIVPEDNINKTVAPVYSKKALILLIVDLFDFPSSIHPGLVDLVGWNKQLIIVGNKFDLIPRDAKNYTERIKNSLKQEVLKLGFMEKKILDTMLISSKTGYGIEELITKIHKLWGFEEDIYMVGSINAGKTSLFNVLLHSDLCKTKAIDFIRASTTSIWPGTTVDLIRFPILVPTPYSLYIRTMRLKRDRDVWAERESLRKTALSQSRDRLYALPTGFVGQSYSGGSNPIYSETYNYPALDTAGTKLLMDQSFTENRIAERPKKGAIDPMNKYYSRGTWLYDTPGTTCSGQFLNELCTEELLHIIPRFQPLPRTFIMKPENVLLLAGLVRLDYLEGDGSIMVTVVASDGVPAHMVWQKTLEKFCQKYMGTEIMKVPFGDAERLKEFPPLEPTDITIQGSLWTQSVADIVLSGMGWIAITAGERYTCKFRVFTPGGQGCSVRKPSLTPYLVLHRGKRIPNMPKFKVRPIRVYK